MDLLIVGSGLYGLTVAERAASAGLNVTIIEKRSHIGGNAYSEFDPATGIEIHKYGSHIFHTSNSRVWNYVNQFTNFTNYIHNVKTIHNGSVFPMPINLGTINQFFNTILSPDEARDFIENSKSIIDKNSTLNFEDRAVSLIGKPLYEAFIRGYTEKQWQTDPRNLPAEIINRLPVRYTYDSRYFSDTWQGLPENGYGAWINNMALNPKISILLSTDFFDTNQPLNIKNHELDVPIIYTGPIDQFFDYQFGRLGWRTLDFEMERVRTQDYQGTSVMNYADTDVPYTRVHEFKHFHPERLESYSQKSTLIVREYSRFAETNDEPYYPINTENDRSKLLKYRALAKKLKNVHFGGRLGSYQYLDMHMAIASALTFSDSFLEERK